MEPEENVAQGSSSGFRWLILATVFATYSLVVLGGIVRATESGDACPDWPRCRGELIPPLETGVMIEFSHRLLASVVGFLVLALVIVAWRTMRNNPTITWGSVLALVLVIAQAILGGMTVLSDLSANLVMAHLALASAVLALLVFLAMSVWISDRPVTQRTRRSATFRNLALFAAIATFALMLTGSFVVGSGAGLAFRDWPLFDGQLMPNGGRLAMIHATHRFVAGAIGLLIGYVALQAWRTQRHDRVLVVGSLFAFGLVMLQALMGAVNVWTMLQPAAMASHLALAVLLWTALVMVTLLAHRSVEGSLPHLSKADGPFVPSEAMESAPVRGS